MDIPPLQFDAPPVIRSTDQTRLVQSVTLTGHGNMSKIKVTKTPLPTTVCDDHVEVQVYYCGLNFTDNYLRLGIIRNRNFPVIMGSECSGIVRRVGNNITDLQVGQRVLCLKMQGGLFRHLVHVERQYCFPLPDDISLEVAVGLGLHFVVAYICLYGFGWLRNTDKVFMQSLAGGVGTALIQLVRTVVDDVQILGTASEQKHDKLKSLGVKRVFRHEENYVARVLKDYPGGVDVVVNTNGGSEIEKCVKMLQPVGKLVLLGSNSAARYPQYNLWGMIRPMWDSGTVSCTEIISRNYCVAGVNMGVWSDTRPEAVKNALDKIFRLYSNGQIQPCIHSVLPFSLVAEGITQLCKRENFGKVILEVKLEAAKPETSAAEVTSPADPQPEVELSEQVDPEVGKADPTFSAQGLIEPAHPKEPREEVAEQKLVEPAHPEKPGETAAEQKLVDPAHPEKLGEKAAEQKLGEPVRPEESAEKVAEVTTPERTT